jgi:hypothetical protein
VDVEYLVDVFLADPTAGDWSVGVSEWIGRTRAPRHIDAVASTIRLHVPNRTLARHRPNADVKRRLKAASGYADTWV